MNIRKKILLIIFSVFLAICLLISCVYYKIYTDFMNDFEKNSTAQLNRIQAFIENFFDHTRFIVEDIADDEIIVDNISNITSYAHISYEHTPIGEELPTEERNIYRRLLSITKQYPLYLFAYVGNYDDGFTQAPDYEISPHYAPTTRPWFTDVIKANNTVLTEAYVDISGDVICTIATPIRDNENAIQGVACLDITLENITKEIDSINIGRTGYTLLFDTLKQVVVDPKNSGKNIPEELHWLGKEIKDLPGNAAEIMEELYTEKPQYKEIILDGKTWLASTRVTNDNWVLVLLQERSEMFQGIVIILLTIIGVGFTITFLLIQRALRI